MGYRGAQKLFTPSHRYLVTRFLLRPQQRHGAVTMTNLIGNDIDSYADWLAKPGATVHLYGKGTAREGRKMGHVTEVQPPGKPPKRPV